MTVPRRWVARPGLLRLRAGWRLVKTPYLQLGAGRRWIARPERAVRVLRHSAEQSSSRSPEAPTGAPGVGAIGARDRGDNAGTAALSDDGPSSSPKERDDRAIKIPEERAQAWSSTFSTVPLSHAPECI